MTDTPVSFGVIILCAIIYLTQFQPAGMALWPAGSGFFAPWQLVTYGFLHGNFNHLFFNMFAVWMFGTPLERAWGSQRFVTYYGVCVIGAGVIQLLVQLMEGGIYPTIGASGGVFGLLLAFGVMWPNNKILLLFFPVPIAAKWFVLIYGAVELLFGVTRTMPGVAHFAHLGGMIFGAILLYRWGWRPGMTWRR
jgi:membrane associated rhomboid family serine protease